jgi:hypothetical protein
MNIPVDRLNEWRRLLDSARARGELADVDAVIRQMTLAVEDEYRREVRANERAHRAQ